LIITIDGPAGSGKSTTARAVANRLGYLYLDTGAMYRAVAYAVLISDDPSLRTDLQNTSEPSGESTGAPNDRLQSFLQDVRLQIRYDGDEQRIHLNGTDVSENIRTRKVGDMASRVSEFAAVREKMVEAQRRVGYAHEEEEGGVVLDGRDTGTVVFPNADLKIYMDADLDERARRRKNEYERQGKEVTLAEVRSEIRERDRKDRERDLAPLQKAEDAVILDTTARSIDEQVAFVLDRVKEREMRGT